MWFRKKILRLGWTEDVFNEKMLRRVGTCQKPLNDLRARRLRFMKHLVRKSEPDNLALTGELCGKGSRGKRQMLSVTNVAQWIR